MNEEIQREIKGPFDWNASENKIFVGCHFIIIYKKCIPIKTHIRKKKSQISDLTFHLTTLGKRAN